MGNDNQVERRIEGFDPERFIEEDLIGQRGFEAPIYRVDMGVNGSFVVTSYDYATERQLTERLMAKAIATEGMKFPVNIFFSDSKGRGTRVAVSQEGEPAESIQ